MKQEVQLLSEIERDFQELLKKKVKVIEYRNEGVPSDEDMVLTMADADPMVCYEIETAVLFIDIRGSTLLNLSVGQKKVVGLYQGFLRAMIQSATMYSGRVRNIVGDRIMVVFPVQNACSNAIRTAILMNSVSMNIIDRYFPDTEIRAGIGLDFGKMLVSKVGLEISEKDKGAYQNLVWLGRPANVASKLTDLANRKGAAAMMSFKCDDKAFSMSSLEVPFSQFHNTFSLHNSGLVSTRIRYLGNPVHDLEILGGNDFSPPILVTERLMTIARKDWQLDDSLNESKWPVIPAFAQNWIEDRVLGGAIQWSRKD